MGSKESRLSSGVLAFEEPLRVKRRNAARSRGSHRLPVGRIGDVASRKSTRNARRGRREFYHDVAARGHVQLAGKYFSIRLVTDADEKAVGPERLDLLCFQIPDFDPGDLSPSLFMDSNHFLNR